VGAGAAGITIAREFIGVRFNVLMREGGGLGSRRICLCQFSINDCLRWRRIVFKLLDIALFDLLHERFAAKEVALKIGGKLARDD